MANSNTVVTGQGTSIPSVAGSGSSSFAMNDPGYHGTINTNMQTQPANYYTGSGSASAPGMMTPLSSDAYNAAVAANSGNSYPAPSTGISPSVANSIGLGYANGAYTSPAQQAAAALAAAGASPFGGPFNELDAQAGQGDPYAVDWGVANQGNKGLFGVAPAHSIPPQTRPRMPMMAAARSATGHPVANMPIMAAAAPQLFAGTNGYTYRKNPDGSYTHIGLTNPAQTPAQAYNSRASVALASQANPVMQAIVGNSGQGAVRPSSSSTPMSAI